MTDQNDKSSDGFTNLPPVPARSLRGFAPNLVTMMAAACGITSIYFSGRNQFREAVVCILLSCVFDGLDGRVARWLHVSSKLGAELDSLSDFVCFGVAPALMIYNCVTQPGVARPCMAVGFWLIALFYALCCGYRLARFNISLETPADPCWTHFFTGLPAPGGALLALLPVFWKLTFGTDTGCTFTVLAMTSLLICGLLMASRIPTLSLKHLHDLPCLRKVMVLILVAAILMMFIRLWPTLLVIGICYYLSVPVCIAVFLKLRRRAA